MDVKLVAIEAPVTPPEAGSFIVRIQLSVDHRDGWYEITARPGLLADFDATLLVPGLDLEAVFRQDQYALHRICRLVGEELRGVAVMLPQRIAA